MPINPSLHATLGNGASANVRGISTAARARDARVYADLARYAVEAGYSDVTATMVHEWVVAGLLPPTADQQSAGRRGFQTVRRPGVKDQLLALCAARQRTKSWDRIRTVLWLDGWAIESNSVKRSVLATVNGPRVSVSSEKDLDALDAFARGPGQRATRRLGVGRLRAAHAAEGVYSALSLACGLQQSLDPESAAAIERVVGVHERSRKDALAGSSPWLEDPPEVALRGLARLFSIQRVRQSVEIATPDDLAQSRHRARFFALDLPDVIHANELCYGRNFAGLHLLNQIGRARPELGVALALHVTRIGWGDRVDELAALAAQHEHSRRGLILLGDYYLQRHPEHRHIVRESGIAGLNEAGLLVPLTANEVAAVAGVEYVVSD